MLNTIIFRGKDLDTSKWVYGFFVRMQDTVRKPIDKKERITHRIYSGFADSCACEKGYDFFGDWTEVNPNTVGQFTGMYDKNGKEIYEGDILLSKDEYGTVEVIFAHGAFQVRYFCKNGEHRIPFTNLKKDYELLGNIHDNPGLLNAVGYKFKENKEGGEE